MRQSIPLHEINPFVRYAGAAPLAASVMNRRVCAPDCRLFCLTKGALRLCAVSPEPVSMRPGDAALVPAGTPYALLPQPGEAGAPVVFIVNFDYTQARRHIGHPLPTLPGDASLPEEELPPRIVDCEALSRPLFVQGASALMPLLSDLERESLGRRRFYEQQMSADMSAILTAFLRLALLEEGQQRGAVEEMLSYIQAHYDRPLTNQEIAAHVNYHPVYANRLLHRHTGMTMHEYLLSTRVQHALGLLLGSDLSITEVALAVGFSSGSRFTKDFKRATGHTPSEFRLSGSK